MTDWTQYHPTQQLTAMDGQAVDIDLEMVPLVQEAVAARVRDQGGLPGRGGGHSGRRDTHRPG